MIKSNSALIIVDVQKYFFEKQFDGYIAGAKKIIPRINKIISIFRSKNLPIFFTRHAHDKNKPTGRMGEWWCDRLPWIGGPESEFFSDVDASKNDTVILKNKYSAFEGTNFHSLLKKQKIKTIYLCGVMTHVCVETTARHAFLLEYEPIVIADACADISEHHHKGSLLNLGHAFAQIIFTKDLRTSL